MFIATSSYVDDTFVVWPHGSEQLNRFLDHLNNIHPKIQFTMEIEQDRQLPFLDILIKKHPDGTLGHTVYRKPTHTNRYLNAASHHHPAQIRSVAKTLLHRSLRLTDKTNMNQELATLETALIQNGFAPGTIPKLLKQKSRTSNTEPSPEPTSMTFLPYIKGTTDKISKILDKHNIKTIFTTSRKIGQLLPSPKDTISLENQGVYKIPCGDCNKVYIGQTNRRINVRKDEHIRAVEKGLSSSSLAQHSITTGHKINFDGTISLATANHFTVRIIREAIEIVKHPHNLNKRDDAQRLPSTWKPSLSNRLITHTLPPTPNTTDKHIPTCPIISHGPMTRSQKRNAAPTHLATPPCHLATVHDTTLRINNENQ